MTVTALTTVFTIARNRSAKVAQAVLGDKDGPIVSERPAQVLRLDRAAYWRQICWSHLRRDFQAMIDRGGPGEPTGRRLLRLVGPAVPLVASARGEAG